MLTSASLDIAILLKSAVARRRLRPHAGTGGTAPPGCSPSSLTPAMYRGGPARPVDDQAAGPDRWIANPGPARERETLRGRDRARRDRPSRNRARPYRASQ